MPRFRQSQTVPYAPHKVFELVADIESYPEFIKWITALRASNHTQTGGVSTCLGEAIIGFKGFTDRFSTTVHANSDEMSVNAELVRGPFRRLNAVWQIAPIAGGGCECTLSIDYEFSNPLIAMLAAANQERAAERILNAFMDEAARRYTANSASPSEPPHESAKLSDGPLAAPPADQGQPQHSPDEPLRGPRDQTGKTHE